MNSIRRQAFWQVFGTIINLGFPLITFPYISRLLGPENLGEVNYLDSLVQFFSFIAAMGIPYYGTKEIAQAKDQGSEQARILYQLLSIHLFFIFVLSVLFFVYTTQFSNVTVSTELIVYALVVLFTQPLMADWYFAGNQKFVFLVKRNMLARLLTLACIFIFIKDRSDFKDYYGLLVGAQVLQVLWNATTYIKTHPFRFSYISHLKRHFRPILLLFATNAFISLYVYLDSVILGNVAGIEAVGLYSAGIKLMRLCLLIIIATLSVLFPLISVLSQKQEIDAICKLVNKAVQIIILFGLPVTLALLMFAFPLISIFAGREFLVSYQVVMILSPLPIIIGLSYLFGSQVLIPLGKIPDLLRTVAIASVFGMIFQVVMAINFSYIGTAVATLLTETGVLLLTFLYVKRYVQIQIPFLFWKACLTFLVFCLPFLLLVLWWVNDLILKLSFGIVWMVFCFSLVIYQFRSSLWDDLLGKGEWIPFIGKRLKNFQVN